MLSHRMRVALVSSFVGAFTIGCRSTPVYIGPDGEPMSPDDFSLVLLRTGPNPDAGTPELFQGHFSFMGELAERGELLLAGPYGKDKAAPDLRGIFLFDEPEPERALETAKGDPTTAAGVFRMEVLPLQTMDVVRLLPEYETRHQEMRAARGDDLTQPDLDAYCIVIADDGAGAVDTFRHPEVGKRVVMFGRLGSPREGALFAILHAESAALARAVLTLGNENDAEFEVSEWYGSPALAALAREASSDDGE